MAPALIMLVLSVIAALGALATTGTEVLTLIQYIALAAGYFLVWDYVREEMRRDENPER